MFSTCRHDAQQDPWIVYRPWPYAFRLNRDAVWNKNAVPSCRFCLDRKLRDALCIAVRDDETVLHMQILSCVNIVSRMQHLEDSSEQFFPLEILHLREEHMKYTTNFMTSYVIFVRKKTSSASIN